MRGCYDNNDNDVHRDRLLNFHSGIIIIHSDMNLFLKISNFWECWWEEWNQPIFESSRGRSRDKAHDRRTQYILHHWYKIQGMNRDLSSYSSSSWCIGLTLLKFYFQVNIYYVSSEITWTIKSIHTSDHFSSRSKFFHHKSKDASFRKEASRRINEQ